MGEIWKWQEYDVLISSGVIMLLQMHKENVLIFRSCMLKDLGMNIMVPITLWLLLQLLYRFENFQNKK